MSTEETTKYRIVHIEDSEGWREMFADMFSQGFGDLAIFESRADCDLLKQELDSGELANAYILDNEIGYDYGGELASQIIDRARELGQDIIVVTLLCSSIPQAEREYGQDLRERNIPILDKLLYGALCGFYVARCLKEGQVAFTDYIEEIGAKTFESVASYLYRYTERTSIADRLMMAVSYGEEGAFFKSFENFLMMNREAMLKKLEGGARRLFDELFPRKVSGVETE